MYSIDIILYFIIGDLERLQRFWMTGTCKPDDHDQNATSDPLALEQFLSAFLLLMGGTLLAAVILLLECLYFNFFRKKLAKTDQGGCCALISLVNIINYFFYKNKTSISNIFFYINYLPKL